MRAIESSGISDADSVAATAAASGLDVEVMSNVSPPIMFSDGRLMVPSAVTVSVTVKVPVPTELQPTTLGQHCRYKRLCVTYCRIVKPGSSGRFASAWRYDYAGVVELCSQQQVWHELRAMATNFIQLRGVQSDLRASAA